jgi:hypothetical protein
MDAELDRMARDIIAAHNGLYHPGQQGPSEDEDGACVIRTGKPAVLLWTGSGIVRTGAHGC